ncbi:MAG: AAA family ATPase [Bacillota bacterium]
MRRELLMGLAIGSISFALWRGVNLLPLLLVGAVGFFVLRNGSAAGLNRSANLVREAGQLGVSFSDIGGQTTAIKELTEALDFLRVPEEIQRLGIRPLKGILLAGPPGTGKTMLAKAAASHTNSVFLTASGSEFIEIYAGVGAQRVRGLFRQAREKARRAGRNSAIIFIDELEVMGGKRGQHSSHLEYDQTLNELLVQMDGIGAGDEIRVLVMGATNRADLLDPALMRPGRFDRVVQVDLPDRSGRLQILQIHTVSKPLGADVDLDALAGETYGFSGAHLESLANEAAILAMREGANAIYQRHLQEAVDKVILGERADRRPRPQDLRRIAVHEAGHALMSEHFRPGSVVALTISPRGKSLGYVRQSPGDDRHLATRRELEEQIMFLLGGTVAEEVVLGEGSTGAGEDLQRAAELARLMVEAGQSDLGLVDSELLDRTQLAAEVGRILTRLQAETRSLVEQHRQALEGLAETALANETLNGDQVRAHLAGRAA